MKKALLVFGASGVAVIAPFETQSDALSFAQNNIGSKFDDANDSPTWAVTTYCPVDDAGDVNVDDILTSIMTGEPEAELEEPAGTAGLHAA